MHANRNIKFTFISFRFSDFPLNAELNPMFSLLALFGAHHILHVSRERVIWDTVTRLRITARKDCLEVRFPIGRFAYTSVKLAGCELIPESETHSSAR